MKKEIKMTIERVNNGFIVKTAIHKGLESPDEQPKVDVAYDVEDLKAQLHDLHDKAFGEKV